MDASRQQMLSNHDHVHQKGTCILTCQLVLACQIKVAQQSNVLGCHFKGESCCKPAELAQLTGLLSCFAIAADLRAVLPPVDEGSFKGQPSSNHNCSHCQRTPPGYRRTDKGRQSFMPSSIWLTKGKRSKTLGNFTMS